MRPPGTGGCGAGCGRGHGPVCDRGDRGADHRGQHRAGDPDGRHDRGVAARDLVNNAHRELLVGLAGALVGELALAGLVHPSGKRFIAVGGPPGDPLLAAAHQAQAQSTGRRAADQLRGLDKAIGGVWSRLGRWYSRTENVA